MRTLETSVDIEATPARVWATLADWPAYPDWNPFVRAIEGRPEVGQRLRVRLQLPGGKPMSVAPTLIAYEPCRRFAWLGRLGLPGVFDGNHAFELEEFEGGTRLIHHERFSGVSVPLLWPLLRRRTEAGFIAMNHALKQRVEAGPAA
jgi:hypothetical protein